MLNPQPQVNIRILDPAQTDDFIKLIRVFEKVFEMKNFKIPDKSHLAKTLNKPGFKAVVAEENETIVGGATIFILDQYYSERPLAYIFDLAIETEFQRQGIGRKIIGFIKEHCRSNGYEEAFVQANEEDDYAVDFYRSTQPTEEEKVIHFSYSFLDKSTELNDE